MPAAHAAGDGHKHPAVAAQRLGRRASSGQMGALCQWGPSTVVAGGQLLAVGGSSGACQLAPLWRAAPRRTATSPAASCTAQRKPDQLHGTILSSMQRRHSAARRHNAERLPATWPLLCALPPPPPPAPRSPLALQRRKAGRVIDSVFNVKELFEKKSGSGHLSSTGLLFWAA